MVGWLQRLTAFVLNEVQATRLARFGHLMVQVLYHVCRKSWEDQFTRRAAALSFFTLINLFPLAGLLLFILSHSVLFQSNMRAIQGALVDQLVTPAAQQVVMDFFDSLSANLSVLGKGLPGVIAVAVLLFLGTSLIVLVEKSLNEIWRSPSRGSAIFARVTLLWMGLTLLPILVGSSFVLSAYFKKGMPHFYLTTHYFLPYLVTFAAFFTLYWFTPRVRMGLRAVALASLVGAVFFEGAKVGLSAYVHLVFKQSAVEKLYGSLALVPIVMIWIYYVWVIVILGAELVYVLHHRQRLQDEARLRQALERGFTPFSRQAAIGLLIEVMDAYERGDGASNAVALAARYQLHPDQVERWFSVLEAEGIVSRTTLGTYLPLKPAKCLSIRFLAELHARRFSGAFSLSPPGVRSWVQEEEDAFLSGFGGRSLADWTERVPCDGAGAPAPEPKEQPTA